MSRYFTRKPRANPSYYATGAQTSYLRVLLRQAESKGIKHGLRLDPNHVNDHGRMTRVAASGAIGQLKRLLGIGDKE